MYDPIRNIDQTIFSHDEQTILKGTKNCINYAKMLLKEIKDVTNAKSHDLNMMKRALIDHMYIIYYCFRCIGIMKLVSKMDVINTVDSQIDNYIEEFFSSKSTYTYFLELKRSVDINDDEAVFYDDMIEKCIKHQKNSLMQKEIKKLTNNISNCLDESENRYIDVSSNMQKYTHGREKILLNGKNYYYLQTQIKNPKTRRSLENYYLEGPNKCLSLLEKLIVLRSECANKLGYETFFESTIEKDKGFDSQEVFELINNHITKIKDRSRKEIGFIYEKLNKDRNKNIKVDTSDFIYYHNLFACQELFSLSSVLKVIFEIIKKYFSISFEPVKSKSTLWNEKINEYKVYNKNRDFLGNVYLDLLSTPNKNIVSPLCIHMCKEFVDINDNKYESRICIIAGYNGDKSLRYSDVLELFKEFGNVIQFLMYKTKTGIMILNDEYNLLTSKVMERVFWDIDTLNSITGNKSEVVSSILATRDIDYAHSIKLKCINSYFDLLIHSSKTLITKIKENNCDGEILKKIYSNIFSNIMASEKEIYKTSTDLIYPITILQEINGTESKVYESIIVEIMSYNIFPAIKKGNGLKYIDILSKAHSKRFKTYLNKYIDTYGDKFEMYLRETRGD
jgi:hypothetical protein